MPYGNLVRDRIPEIIKAKGKNPIAKILDDKSYSEALKQKLQEEIDKLRSKKARERDGFGKKIFLADATD